MGVVPVYIGGITGRVGKQIKTLVDNSSNFCFSGGLSRKKCDSPAHNNSVVVDFSLPQALPEIAKLCKTNNFPLVSGTTGYNESHQQQLKDLSHFVPVFWSANMSLGIHIMNKIISEISPFRDQYQARLSETHHEKKRDRPSGTALKIKEAANKKGLNLENIESLRIGDEMGSHSFFFENTFESLEITHRAKNRTLYAKGALDVSLWIQSQPPGFYEMNDIFQ